MCSDTESKPSEKPSTIMEPYSKGLRFIKLLGLPMKMKLSKDGNLIFEDHLRLLKCGCASGIKSNFEPPLKRRYGIESIIKANLPLVIQAIGYLLGSISTVVLLINGINMRDLIKLGASKYGFESKYYPKRETILMSWFI